MRRPGPIPRGAKREEGIPFHPVPRVVSAGMRHSNLGDEFGDMNSEGYIESKGLEVDLSEILVIE